MQPLIRPEPTPDVCSSAESVFKAAYLGCRKRVLEALEAGLPLGSTGDFDRSLLYYAAMSNDTVLVLELLKRGAEISPPQGKPQPLMAALTFGSDDMVNIVLEGVMERPGWAPSDCSVLIRAVKKRKSEVVRRLLDAGYEAACRQSEYGGSRLLGAALGDGCIRNFELLLERGVDPDVYPPGDEPLVMLVVSSEEFRRALLKTGVAVDQRGVGGQTALMRACDRSNVDAVDDLLKATADFDLSDESGETALHYAVRSRCLDCITRLLDAGAEAAKPNREGQSPIDIANEPLRKVLVAPR